jgi:D-alanine--poly(phosphoribitol) ligase subunit 1
MFHENVLIPFLKVVNNFRSDNAFCIDEKFYTYYDFTRNISKIRKALHTYSLSSKNIGLVANDDIETYASIFAIWFEGYAYVPLHPNQPIERSLEIASQANIELIINSVDNNMFPNIRTINSANLQFTELLLQPELTSDDNLAYILFTSGSTGKPKGVPIIRKNLGAFIDSFYSVGFQIDNNDRCLQCFDLTFDVSVQSFLVPLLKGACAYTIPHDQIKYSYVYGLLEDHQLTFGVMAPSMLRYLRPYFDEIEAPSMKYCILTAEASPVDLINEWSKCIPNAEIFDFYGPTEATIYCTYYKFITNGINKHYNGMLSIGKAMRGITSIIIDEEKNILATNEKGELCISGDQLTPGYWKNSEKNETSFFEKKVGDILQRFYKTGDLCYLDDDGDIMYSGRIDFQVKIQGFRIELGEIEHHARESVNGRNAIAVAFENSTGNTEIALCIEGELADTTSLLENLKSKMPYYMIPTKILVRKEFPLNSNGKIDRNMLKKLISE